MNDFGAQENGLISPYRRFTRAELGLPHRGFVFCCFNASYKILPATFAIWMRLLRQVDGSVLWLLGDSPDSITNLRREAAGQGVDGRRLVFADRMPGAHQRKAHALHDGADVGEIDVDKAGDGDQVGDALDRLAQHVVRHFERV